MVPPALRSLKQATNAKILLIRELFYEFNAPKGVVYLQNCKLYSHNTVNERGCSAGLIGLQLVGPFEPKSIWGHDHLRVAQGCRSAGMVHHPKVWIMWGA